MLEKKYGIFLIKKKVLYGYVENSFSMSWEPNYVRAWKLEDLQWIWNNGVRPCGLDTKYIKGIKSKYPKAFIVRITDNFPEQFQKKLGKKIKIHWKERQDILNRTEKEQKEKYISKKYHYRNVRFIEV